MCGILARPSRGQKGEIQLNWLELRDLQFSYAGADDVAYDFNLQIGVGAILAIVGKSGSGKSTLLDLIAGFLKPASGNIFLNGHEMTHLPPSNRQISILFQKNNLFEHLTVMQNVCLGLNPNSVPTRAQIVRATKMLRRVGLENFENRRATTLSGGQKQRVALARELLRQSSLILLDEPFSGLDEETRDIMLPLLKHAVSTAKRSIILVTHDLQSVEGIVDHVGEISNGGLNLVPSTR
jgi:thiamine transport system ATP-binding protein